MNFVSTPLERLSGSMVPEAVGLKVAEPRSFLTGFIVLALVLSLKYAACIFRLANRLMYSRRDDVIVDSSPLANIVAATAEVSSSALVLELSRKDVDPIVELYEKAKTPPGSPPLRSPSSWHIDDSLENGSQGFSEPLEPMSGFDEMWSSTEDSFAGPEAAVTADANSVLETALASGDAKLADAALAAGVRLCSSSWLTKACGQLQASGIPLMPERLLELIRVYGQARRADLAVDLWESHCVELGLDPADGDGSEPPPAAELYGAALEACARAGDFETAAHAASSTGWRAPLCRHGQAAFLALARWYARRQDVEQALVCYQAVREITGSADLTTHRAILYASVRSADMAKADVLFDDLSLSSVTPDGASFSAMICGHCAAGNIDKAMCYFDLLRERDIIPTAPLFDAILDGCSSAYMPALVEQVLADMEATGIHPSTTTLSILMRIHGSNRDTDQALAIFDEFPKRHGLKLDGHAYGTLVSVCLKNGAYDMAWNAFDRMTAAGCIAHVRTYEALIAACLRQGHLNHAVGVVYAALGMSDQQANDTTVRALRLSLQPKTIEDVLNLICRRRQAACLGVPLVQMLLESGVHIVQSLVEAVHRSATAGAALPSELHRRRAKHHEWRNVWEVSSTS